MVMKITKLETADEVSMLSAGTLQTYLDDDTNYSQVVFKKSQKPDNGWAMPYVTGHKYRVQWAQGLEFEYMNYELSDRWENTDLTTYFQLNFTEPLEGVNFTSNGAQILNNTLSQSAELLENGDNMVLNATDKRLIEFVANGKNELKKKVKMTGL